MDVDLTPQEHHRLQRIVARQVQKAAKDRAFCRALGNDWLAFLEDKPRGDPRIIFATKLYDLEYDTLTRYARIAQWWEEWPAIDAWVAETNYKSDYQHEPQRSTDQRRAYLNYQSGTEAIRLAPSDSSETKIELLCGDALSVIKTLPDQQFHTCITSPPYFRMRDWGPGAIGMEADIPSYIDKVVGVFRELRRVLRNDAICWVNIGDRYASAERKEVDRDRFHKHPIPASKADIVPLGNLLLIPQRLAIALQDDGWIVRAVITWDKTRQVSSGVSNRPLATSETILMLSKKAQYYYRELSLPTNYPRRAGPFQRKRGKKTRISGTGYSKSADVLRIPSEGHKEGHNAPFPVALADWCVERTCPTGGSIIDPFCGSGTVGVVAVERDVSATLIDINPQFIELSKRRIAIARTIRVTPQAQAAD